MGGKVKNILAIIPARGGSKGILNKNIRILAGKPLIAHPIETAKQSKYINKIVISTDNSEIKRVSLEHGAEVVDRPDNLSGDKSAVSDAIRYTVDFLEKNENYQTDIIVLLECTSPIKSVEDIDKGIEEVMSGRADSSTSFKESSISPNRLWKITDAKVETYIEGADPFLPRQMQPVAYQLTGQFYVLTNEILKNNPDTISIMLGKIYPVIATTPYFVDIDEEVDLIIAEEFFKKIKTYEKS